MGKPVACISHARSSDLLTADTMTRGDEARHVRLMSHTGTHHVVRDGTASLARADQPGAEAFACRRVNHDALQVRLLLVLLGLADFQRERVVCSSQ